MKYFVYILRCNDDTFYTGITTDIVRRVTEHNESNKGSKYTKIRRPVRLIYTKEFANRSSASSEEFRIKQLSHTQKKLLITRNNKNYD